MSAEPAKPRSCFLHVPKSGGTALTLYLRSVLGKRHVFHVGEGRYRKAPLEGLMKRYPVITGHFNVAQIPERLFLSTFFFTFLREPVDRIVSMYHFFKEGDMDSDHRVVINEEWSLERALDKWARPGSCSAWSNEQTFLFSGATDTEQPPESLLPLALRNLERFDFVGIHERFAEGVESLGRLRGWPLNAPVPRFKTSRKRLAVEDVESALVERILAANRCDVELYARARELWETARSQASRLPAVAMPIPLSGLDARLPPEGAAVIFPEQLVSTLPDPAAPDSPVGSLLPRIERGDQEISFNSVDAFDLRTGGDAVIQQGNPVEIRLAVYSTIDTDDINVGLRICDEADMEVYGVSTRMQGRSLTLEGGTITLVTFVFEMSLAPGGYFLSVALQGGDTHDEKLFHWIDNALLFWCVDERAPTFVGVADLHARMKVARAVFTEKRWFRPPKAARRVLRVGRQKGHHVYLRGRQLTLDFWQESKARGHALWHTGKALIPHVRPPKLVRFVVRTIRSEGWGAGKIFLGGKPPPKREE